MKCVVVSVAICLLAGCASSRATTRPSTKPASKPPQIDMSTRSEGPLLSHLDIYQMTVPMGSLSRSDDFWKRVDEHAIDVATYDLLLRNGVRVGLAPSEEWGFLKKIIDANPNATKKMRIEGVDVKQVELEMTKEVDEQTIFFFDGKDNPGRQYDKSKNMMMLSFQRAPRRDDAVRVSLVPMVKSTRKRLMYTPMNEEVEVQYVAPETLYECNLRTEIPVGKFLIVAPSPDAYLKWSLGNRFFIKESPAELEEQILLIVPQTQRLQQGVVTRQ